MTSVRTQSCRYCPYRQDVPSGIWSAEDYLKLPPYDAPTGDQPIATFQCHATPEFYCHGWAVVHSSRGHQFELLALRIWHAEIPKAAIALFASGAEAAAHGLRNLKQPTLRARRAAKTLAKRYLRLRT